MSNKLKGAWWTLTAVACIFLAAFAFAGKTPVWYGTAIAVVVAVSGIVFGKPWSPPSGP